jgi:hypothetical protein
VDVTLEIANITAAWIQPPPPALVLGEDFTVAVEIVGAVAQIDGVFMGCEREWSPNDFCSFPTRLEGEVAPSFAGPPGVFSYEGHRSQGIDILHIESNFFALFHVTDLDGRRTGPYYSPFVPIAMPEADRPWLQTSPRAVEIHGFAGQYPLVGNVTVWAWIGEFTFEITADQPWLRVEPATGRSFRRGGRRVRLIVDPRQLEPAEGVHHAMLRIDAPETIQGTASVPVTVEIRPVH